MKRLIVWIDSADKDTHQIRDLLKEYLAKAGVRYTIFEAYEVMESETE